MAGLQSRMAEAIRQRTLLELETKAVSVRNLSDSSGSWLMGSKDGEG